MDGGDFLGGGVILGGGVVLGGGSILGGGVILAAAATAVARRHKIIAIYRGDNQQYILLNENHSYFV